MSFSISSIRNYNLQLMIHSEAYPIANERQLVHYAERQEKTGQPGSEIFYGLSRIWTYEEWVHLLKPDEVTPMGCLAEASSA